MEGFRNIIHKGPSRTADRWRCLGLLLLIFHLTAFGVWAASMIEGTVVSLQPKRGMFTVLQAGSMKVVNVIVPSGKLPGAVIKGANIRIWGNFLNAENPLFRAQRIIGIASVLRGKDPTGVRSRLNRGRRVP